VEVEMLILCRQWAMIGGMLVIFLLLPETPWWLVEHGKIEKAQKVLLRFNGHLPGYNVNEVLVRLQ